MKDFVFIYRNTDTGTKPSPEQMQQITTDWMNWLGSIAAQGKLGDRGNRLSMSEAKFVGASNTVTDGPYTEIKEFINGYSIVRVANMDEAVELAKGCPIFKAGGKVEVRGVVSPDDNS